MLVNVTSDRSASNGGGRENCPTSGELSLDAHYTLCILASEVIAGQLAVGPAVFGRNSACRGTLIAMEIGVAKRTRGPSESKFETKRVGESLL